MGTSWVAVSINNITTRASREMTSRKNIKIFDFNGVNIATHWLVAGEVFAISDCLVIIVIIYSGHRGRRMNVCMHICTYINAHTQHKYMHTHTQRHIYIHTLNCGQINGTADTIAFTCTNDGCFNIAILINNAHRTLDKQANLVYILI